MPCFVECSVESQEEQSGTLLYSITYDFIDCDDNKPTKDIIDVRIKECSDNTAALVQQPIQLLEVKAATMPANCESFLRLFLNNYEVMHSIM